MKFSTVAKGKRAERPLPVPGYEGFVVLLRPLTGLETDQAYAAAHEHARSKGIENPREGDTVYDLAIMAHVIAIGCVDPDSPEKDRAPSFDGGAAQVLAELGIETIAYLHEQHQLWQDECSPYQHKIGDGELLEKVREVAGPDGHLPFMRLSPATRWGFTLSMANLLLISPDLKSLFGWTSDGGGSKPQSEPATATPAPETTASSDGA